MTQLELLDENYNFLEHLEVKTPQDYILYRGRLFQRVGLISYIQRQYLEIG